MNIASLAQGARQSLARGLEALQARDAPLGLLDVAQPVARAIGGLVDLELAPHEATATRVEDVLEALREGLRQLQAPEHVEHPAAARGMKAVAEALAVVMMLSRAIREGRLPANDFSASPATALSAVAPRAEARAVPASSAFLRAAAMESALAGPPSAPPRTAAANDATVTARSPSAPPRVGSAGDGASLSRAPSAPPETGSAIDTTLTGTAPSAHPRSGSAIDTTLTGTAPSAHPRSGSAIDATLTGTALSAQPRNGSVSDATLTGPSLSTGSGRPSLRALAAASQSAEPAVVTRAVNAVMGPAPSSMRVEAPPVSAEAISTMRTETVSAQPDPLRAPQVVLSRTELSPSVRVEPPRGEPSIALRDPGQTPEPPPLLSTRPLQILEARTGMPSRAPVSIRRDVVAERDLRSVDAALGAHSPSNFYTGLAGGDVVVSGGLFVATYQVPKVGEKVLLKISMPGGYEFVAKAKVAWTRDVATSLSPGSIRGVLGAPGFGAQFCEITDEGRRLIQRYVRNREPLFHEDSL